MARFCSEAVNKKYTRKHRLHEKKERMKKKRKLIQWFAIDSRARVPQLFQRIKLKTAEEQKSIRIH